MPDSRSLIRRSGTVLVDGTFGRHRTRADEAEFFARHVMGWAEPAVQAWRDRATYHPANPKDYGSTVGIMDEDGNCYCVGCWWCCAEEWTPAVYFAAMENAHD